MLPIALLLLFTAPAALIAQPGRLGLPSCKAHGQALAVRAAFILCHSESLEIPVWTTYELKHELPPARLE